MADSSTSTSSTSTNASRTSERIFAGLLGLATLAILLQGLWAGLFLEHDGKRDQADNWIGVHARGADIAIVLAALAAVVAFAKLRHRRDLWGGAVALTVLLVVEAYLGGRISDEGDDVLTAVHVPLAMAILAVAIWVTMRIRRGGAGAAAYPDGEVARGSAPVSAAEAGRRTGR